MYTDKSTRKKLTIYSNEEIIKNAKKIALDNDMSLSDIIENLLFNLEVEVNNGKTTMIDLYGKNKIETQR
ncbi:MAG: DUF6364 family protein [Paraclostridium sp.]